MVLLVPTGEPFTFHWYMGDEPPLAGVAVYSTDVPAQTALAEELMLTLAGTELNTVITTWFEVAGFPEVTGKLDVNTQVTASLFAGVYVKEELLVPASEPLTFH